MQKTRQKKTVKLTRAGALQLGLSSVNFKNVGCKPRGRFSYKASGTGSNYFPSGEQALMADEERGR